MAPQRLLILGAGGHGRAVADLAQACGWRVAGFTERPGAARAEVLGVDEDAARLIAEGRADAAVVGIGATSLRRRAELWDALGRAGAPRPTLVHPRATVSPSCRIGAGSVVFPGCVLGADVEIGDNVVLYSGVIAEHGTRVGDHAYCSPGVVLSGAVVVESGAFLGSGAVVLPGLVVGAGGVVAAGAVVTADVPPGRTVRGVPAREAASA